LCGFCGCDQSGSEATEAIDGFFHNTWNAQRTQPPPLLPPPVAAAPEAPNLAHPPHPAPHPHPHPPPPHHPQQPQGPGVQSHAHAHAPQHRHGQHTGVLTPMSGQPGSPGYQQGQQAFSSQAHFQQQAQQQAHAHQMMLMGLQQQQALAAAALSMPRPGSLDGAALSELRRRRNSNDSNDGAAHVSGILNACPLAKLLEDKPSAHAMWSVA
jgi:hypothetical protein